MALTLRDLRYFVAVADELNMTRAAARLHLSQPALSAALQRLEREVGVSLLQRHGRGVALTAAGEAFVSKARIVLARADDAVETMKDAPASASIVLGFLAPEHEVAGRAVKAFRDTHAHVDVRWEPLDVVNQLSLLHSASVDVAFVWESQDDPDIKFATIATESRAVLLAQDYPLASKPFLTYADVARELHRDLHPGAPRAFADLCSRADPRKAHPRLTEQPPTTVEEVWALVASQELIAILPATLARACERCGVVSRRLVDVPPAALKVAWRRVDNRPQVQAFVAQARL